MPAPDAGVRQLAGFQMFAPGDDMRPCDGAPTSGHMQAGEDNKRRAIDQSQPGSGGGKLESLLSIGGNLSEVFGGLFRGSHRQQTVCGF
jgi:hypothetical protein